MQKRMELVSLVVPDDMLESSIFYHLVLQINCSCGRMLVQVEYQLTAAHSGKGKLRQAHSLIESSSARQTPHIQTQSGNTLTLVTSETATCSKSLSNKSSRHQTYDPSKVSCQIRLVYWNLSQNNRRSTQIERWNLNSSSEKSHGLNVPATRRKQQPAAEPNLHGESTPHGDLMGADQLTEQW